MVVLPPIANRWLTCRLIAIPLSDRKLAASAMSYHGITYVPVHLKMYGRSPSCSMTRPLALMRLFGFVLTLTPLILVRPSVRPATICQRFDIRFVPVSSTPLYVCTLVGSFVTTVKLLEEVRLKY